MGQSINGLSKFCGRQPLKNLPSSLLNTLSQMCPARIETRLRLDVVKIELCVENIRG